MTTAETVVAIVVIAGIVGQAWLVTSARRRADRQIRQSQAAKKAALIEAEFDKQAGGKP